MTFFNRRNVQPDLELRETQTNLALHICFDELSNRVLAMRKLLAKYNKLTDKAPSYRCPDTHIELTIKPKAEIEKDLKGLKQQQKHLERLIKTKRNLPAKHAAIIECKNLLKSLTPNKTSYAAEILENSVSEPDKKRFAA